MTNVPRKTVNIVSRCESWLAEAQAKHSEIVKQIEHQEGAMKDALSSNKRRISEIEEKLASILKTIKAVIAQEGDASSLEKKKAEVESQLIIAKSNADFSNRVAEIEVRIADLSKKAEAAAKVAGDKAKQLDIAKHLAASFDLDDSYGAKVVPEYETLAEAAHDYAVNVRFDVGIAGTQIEKVVIWQVPEAGKPTVVDVSAQPGLKYLIKALPSKLSWLGNFPAYSAMPKSTSTHFTNGDVRFVPTQTNGEDDESGEPSGEDLKGSSKRPAWMRTFTRPSKPSLYFQGKSSGRSGLCFVKESASFYSLWPDKFSCAIQKTKREFRRDGYMHREMDVEYAEAAEFDASCLLADLFTHAYPLIEEATKEMGSLQSAKSKLGIKIRDTICAVANTNNLFVERNQRLSGAEINTEVGAYWDAFVNAPWEFYVHGNCAILKHLCERKLETPHAYSYPVKGHYGLRVRTRDHSWILATLFCPPDALCPKEPIKPADVTYHTNSTGRCTSFVSIGPCCLYIYTEE